MEFHSQNLPHPVTDLTAEDLSRLLSGSEVALDTETLGLDPNRDPLCLVQLCAPDGQLHVIRSADWSQVPRLRMLLQAPVVKVCHNALFDCSMLLANLKVGVVNPYCTRIASKLARTYANQHSLAALFQELFQIDLSKELQVSDWSAELSEDQLAYAVTDVVRLLEIKRLLEDKLARRPLLRTGLSAAELNRQCQKLIPTLVQLKVNGWNVEIDGSPTVFGR